MKHKLLIGIAGGALALALAGGAVYAGPSIKRSLAVASQAATPTAQPNTTQAARGTRRAMAANYVRVLIKAAADATGTQPKDVLAALRDGKSLAQYAQAHGKSDQDVLQAARATIQQRLSQAVANGKLTQVQSDALLKKFDDAAPKTIANANLGQQIGRALARQHPLGAGLVKATADVTGTQPKDVLAALRGGQSLAQYAQAHGKTADHILAKLRELGQQRLDKALDRAKDLIDKPGLGRNPNGGASTSGGANK